jgi:hypothetical protein
MNQNTMLVEPEVQRGHRDTGGAGPFALGASLGLYVAYRLGVWCDIFGKFARRVFTWGTRARDFITANIIESQIAPQP